MKYKNKKNMKKAISIIEIFMLVLMLSGCGITQDKSNAESIAISVFENIKTGNIDKALTFYSSKFFEGIAKEEWKSILDKMDAKIGNIQSYELVSWNVKKQAHTSGSGTYCVLQYKIKRLKYPATETLTIFKPIGGEFQVLGHNINSIGLLKE